MPRANRPSCGNPRCPCCHLSPHNKSSGKVKGSRKAHAFSLLQLELEGRQTAADERREQWGAHGGMMLGRDDWISAVLRPDEDVECVICHESHAAYSRLCCDHVFGASCIKRWFQNSRTCPQCRAAIT